MRTRKGGMDDTDDKIVDVAYPRVIVRIDYRFTVNNPKIHGSSGSVGSE